MQLFVLIFLLVASISAHAEGLLPVGNDLPKISSQSLSQNQAIVLVFTANHCEYCELLKANVINPMLLSQETMHDIVVREVNVNNFLNMKDFNGKALAHDQFAAKHHVIVTPTVAFFRPGGGEEAVTRIVGYNGSDFYFAQLEEAIAAARATPRD